MSFNQMEKHAVQSWKSFSCTLAKVKASCVQPVTWDVSVSDIHSEAFTTAPSRTVHTEAKSRLFFLPFEIPSSSFAHVQPSAAHLSSAAIRKKSFPLSWLLPGSQSLAEHPGGSSH